MASEVGQHWGQTLDRYLNSISVWEIYESSLFVTVQAAQDAN